MRILGLFVCGVLVAVAQESSILGDLHALGSSSFVGFEGYDDEISEFSAAPRRMLGKPVFALGTPTFHPLQSNFTVRSNPTEGREIRRAPISPIDPNIPYVFPPPAKLPLPSCFYNPAGYVCCNRELYDFIEGTYKEIAAQSSHNPCNIQTAVNKLHSLAEAKFNVSMEAMLGLDDFAQKVRFRGTLACKLEVLGKYILMYSTPLGNTRRKREVSDLDPTSLNNEHAAFL